MTTATNDRILLGTRKGLITLARNGHGYSVDGEAHRGMPVPYAATAREGVMWASLELGHWGPKLSRSDDGGTTWTDVEPPRYPGDEGDSSLEAVWVIAEGHPERPDQLWLGTFPGGLFRSDDGGRSFELVEALWNHETRETWMGGGRDTPGIHSVVIDPRDPERVMIAVSCAGVFETTDDGATWTPRNVGMPADFLPSPDVVAGHDPHSLSIVPGAPDVVWQQNHCGIERTTDGGLTWAEISEADGPARFGFAIVAHDTDPDTAWVVPGESDEVRTTADGALRVCRTENGGRTWERLTDGLPQEHAYDLVYRHALDRRGEQLVFGSTTGNVYWSGDSGDSWESLGTNFPPVYSARFA